MENSGFDGALAAKAPGATAVSEQTGTGVGSLRLGSQTSSQLSPQPAFLCLQAHPVL